MRRPGRRGTDLRLFLMRGYHEDSGRCSGARATRASPSGWSPKHAELPAVAQEFLAGLPLLFVAAPDPEGQVWASVLSGPPGFVDTPDERTVTIAAAPLPDAPLGRALAAGEAPVGLLAIDLATRRRVRVNGRVTDVTAAHAVIAVRETYPNCPKYIQPRAVPAYERGPASPSPAAASGRGSAPPPPAFVAAADTFFVASRHPERGLDASHRGGPAGFVTVHDDARWSVPDYAGNTMYKTLGNLAVRPARRARSASYWETRRRRSSSRGARRSTGRRSARRRSRARSGWSISTSTACWRRRVRSRTGGRSTSDRASTHRVQVTLARRYGSRRSDLLPRSWPGGVPVFASDGAEIGNVAHVLADPDADIFDGIVIDTQLGPGGHRFADAAHVDRLYHRRCGARRSGRRKRPTSCPSRPANPAVLGADPDDATPDDLGEQLKRAWNWISGNY